MDERRLAITLSVIQKERDFRYLIQIVLLLTILFVISEYIAKKGGESIEENKVVFVTYQDGKYQLNLASDNFRPMNDLNLVTSCAFFCEFDVNEQGTTISLVQQEQDNGYIGQNISLEGDGIKGVFEYFDLTVLLQRVRSNELLFIDEETVMEGNQSGFYGRADDQEGFVLMVENLNERERFTEIRAGSQLESSRQTAIIAQSTQDVPTDIYTTYSGRLRMISFALSSGEMPILSSDKEQMIYVALVPGGYQLMSRSAPFDENEPVPLTPPFKDIKDLSLGTNGMIYFVFLKSGGMAIARVDLEGNFTQLTPLSPAISSYSVIDQSS